MQNTVKATGKKGFGKRICLYLALNAIKYKTKKAEQQAGCNKIKKIHCKLLIVSYFLSTFFS